MSLLQRFDTTEEIKAAVAKYFQNLDAEYCRAGLQKLHKRYTKCLDLQGYYVEKQRISSRICLYFFQFFRTNSWREKKCVNLLFENPLYIKFEEEHNRNVDEPVRPTFMSYAQILCKDGAQHYRRWCHLNFDHEFEFSNLEFSDTKYRSIDHGSPFGQQFLVKLFLNLHKTAFEII